MMKANKKGGVSETTQERVGIFFIVQKVGNSCVFKKKNIFFKKKQQQKKVVPLRVGECRYKKKHLLQKKTFFTKEEAS